MPLGPVQMLVIGTSAEPDGSVLAELDRLAEQGIVRLIDLLVVEHSDEGSLDTIPAPDGLHPGLGRIAEEFLAGPAAFTPGADADPQVEEPDLAGGAATWSLLEAVPMGGTAVVALIEHVWAVPLRTALLGAGAEALGESWLGPADLADLQAIVDRHAGS
jgi:hypothetical protein